MKRAIFIIALALMAVAAMAAPTPQPAQAPKWYVVATVRDDAGVPVETWSIRAGSIGTTDDGMLFAVVEVSRPSDRPQESPIYSVIVNSIHCNSRRGDIAIKTLDGVLVESGVYVKGTNSVGEHIAAHLCRRGGAR